MKVLVLLVLTLVVCMLTAVFGQPQTVDKKLFRIDNGCVKQTSDKRLVLPEGSTNVVDAKLTTDFIADVAELVTDDDALRRIQDLKSEYENLPATKTLNAILEIAFEEQKLDPKVVAEHTLSKYYEVQLNFKSTEVYMEDTTSLNFCFSYYAHIPQYKKLNFQLIDVIIPIIATPTGGVSGLFFWATLNGSEAVEVPPSTTTPTTPSPSDDGTSAPPTTPSPSKDSTPSPSGDATPDPSTKTPATTEPASSASKRSSAISFFALISLFLW